MKFLILFCLLFSTSVFAGQGGEYVRGYLGEWLKAHGFKDFTLSESGLVIDTAGLTLDGEIYGINELKKGELYSAETQLKASFPAGRILEDFAAGAGQTPEDAFLDSLNNFCLTTLHPIFAELFDHNDPHVNRYEWEISGKKRNIFLTDWGQRGESVEVKNLKNVESLIEKQLSSLNISNDLHWVKLVVSNVQGKVDTVVLTVDGLSYEQLNKEIANYNWPSSKEFYMVKLFLVVGKI